MFRFFDNLAFPCLVTGSDAAQTGRIGILFIGKYFPLFSQILRSPDMGIFRFLADFRFFPVGLDDLRDHSRNGLNRNALLLIGGLFIFSIFFKICVFARKRLPGAYFYPEGVVFTLRFALSLTVLEILAKKEK